jgi:hypothetical protein
VISFYYGSNSGTVINYGSGSSKAKRYDSYGSGTGYGSAILEKTKKLRNFKF